MMKILGTQEYPVYSFDFELRIKTFRIFLEHNISLNVFQYELVSSLLVVLVTK